MRKRILGKTGFELTELGYGAWALGGTGKVENYGEVHETEAIAVLHKYVEEGGNYIDTARAYNNCENIIGKFFIEYGKRENIFISTKTVAGANAETLDNIRNDIETSLRMLNTDYIDILFLHQPPEEKDVMNKALDILLEIKEEGKIRSIGASIKGVDVTKKTEALCRQYIKTAKIDVIQLVYSILRQRLLTVIQEAKNSGVGIIARTALESGLLTGKYRVGQTFSGQDQRRRYKEDNLEFILKTTEALQEIAKENHYSSISNMAIKFALAPEGVTSLIIGAKNVAQLQQNMKTSSLPDIDDALLKKLYQNYGNVTDRANYLT